MNLKPRQIEAYNAIFDALERGIQRQLVNLPTWVGKTVLAAHVARQFQRVLFLCHRAELVEQTARTMRAVDPERQHGRIAPGIHEIGQFTVGMLPTVYRRLGKIDPATFDCVIIDECFPAGTLIDGKPIEQLAIGDAITAFDEQTGTLRQAQVTRTFKNPAPESLYRFRINGRSLVCTPNHPVLTESGWKAASLIVTGQYVFEVPYVCENPLSAMRTVENEQQQGQSLPRLPEEAKSDRESNHSSLLYLQDASGGHYAKPAAQGEQERQDFLLSRLRFGFLQPAIEPHDDKNQSWEKCITVRSNDAQQPNAQPEQPIEDVANPKEDWSSAQGQRRERHGLNCSSAEISGSVEVGNRGVHSNQDSQRERIPDLLQSGHCRSAQQSGRRGGRKLSLCDPEKKSGSQKGGTIKPVRVDSVEVFQQGRNAEFAQLCPDGFVYNITVEPCNTYIANGFVVHNCHHAASRTWRETLDHFTPRLRIGLTATPERLDGLALSNLFDAIVHSMSLMDAVNENYLVPPSAIQCLTSVNISTVRTRGGDLAEDELAALVDDPARNAFIAEKYVEHCTGRRAIAFCVNIAHAKNLVTACLDAGITAEWISGDDPERESKLARFARGEFQLLANCQILTEGFDDRGVDAILLCRPTKSRSLFAQMIGRGLRLSEGKTDCRVLDFVDNAGKHCLVTAWRFFGYQSPPPNERPRGIPDPANKKESKITTVDLERQIDLLKPPEIDAFNYGSRDWHYQEATEKQLLFLAQLGYDTANNDFSKGQACALIGNQPASYKQLRKLADCGYDVSAEWTRAQADKALADSVSKMSRMIEKIKARGFSIEATGNSVKVEPFDKLDLLQRGWLDAHRKPLLVALQA